jgi:hypothetical protein
MALISSELNSAAGLASTSIVRRVVFQGAPLPRHRNLHKSQQTGCVSFSILQLLFVHFLERYPVFCGQVIHLIFVVRGERPEVPPWLPTEIDHSQATSLALAALRVTLPDLVKSSNASDNITCFRRFFVFRFTVPDKLHR